MDAYRLAGFSTGSVSLKGCFVLSPYTELDDAYTTAGMGFSACGAMSMSKVYAEFER